MLYHFFIFHKENLCVFSPGTGLLCNGEVFLSFDMNKKSDYVLLAFVCFGRFNQKCCNETNR